MNRDQFFLDLWAERPNGQIVYPYKGVKGGKKGLYSVNFTNDTNNFEGLSEEQLIEAVLAGRFAERGTIRMIPLDAEPGVERNAFAPTHYRGQPILQVREHASFAHRQSGSVFPDEVREPDGKPFSEGAARKVLVNAFERSTAARDACIAHHGAICTVCTIDFGATYGEIGTGFIHVHHVRKIADLGAEYVVDPIRDLVPVCPNCHAMLHRVDPPLDIEELQSIFGIHSREA